MGTRIHRRAGQPMAPGPGQRRQLLSPRRGCQDPTSLLAPSVLLMVDPAHQEEGDTGSPPPAVSLRTIPTFQHIVPFLLQPSLGIHFSLPCSAFAISF